MELSPKLYHYLVRPKWFSNIFFYKMLQEYINVNDRTVLDFGCGIGSSSFLFDPLNYFGVDCDHRRIEYAKKLYPKHNFIAINNGQLPLSKNSVDYVLISSVLHHIPPDLLSNYMKEFRRVIKSDGSLIIAEPCFSEKARLQNWCMLNFDKGNYIMTEDEYLDAFRKANFRTKVIKRYNQLLFYNKIIFCACPLN